MRPEVSSSSSELGYLPGDQEEKLKPWLAPYFQALARLGDEQNIGSKESLKDLIKI